MQKAGNIAILWAGRRMVLADSISVGNRIFPGQPTGPVSVSPDAQSVAWAPKVELDSISDRRLPLLSVSGAKRDVRAVALPGSYAVGLAVSDAGGCILALVGSSGSPSIRLLRLNGASIGASPVDVTNLAKAISLSSVVRLGISGSGRLAVLGSEDEFVVLDLSVPDVVLRSQGRNPSISPAGDRVAFLDRVRGLVVRTLSEDKSVRLLGGVSVSGTGAWSPDGRFLLLGAFTSLSLQRRLVALDVDVGGICEVALLPEGDDGSRSAWISTSLLVA
jgi:hypothetical protein